MLPSRLLSVSLATFTVIACRTSAPSPAPQTVVERGTVKVAGFEVPYVTEGSGRPCVVYALLGYHLRAFSAAFKNQFRCTFAQARFAIPGTTATAPYRIDTAVEELEAVRATLGLGRFVLVGHSVQSVVALAYAKRYPQHASHVIAIGSTPEISPRYFQLEEEGWQAKASADRKAARQRRTAALTEDALAKLSPSEAIVATVLADGPKRWWDATYDERPLLSHDQFDPALIGSLFTNEYRLLADGEVFDVPVLLAEGRLDWDFGGEAIWASYRGRFRDLTIEIFEKSGHVPQLEEAQAFDARVAAWLVSR